MPLSFIISQLKLQGGCIPGDGGQVAVTGSWYNSIFNLLLLSGQLF